MEDIDNYIKKLKEEQEIKDYVEKYLLAVLINTACMTLKGVI